MGVDIESLPFMPKFLGSGLIVIALLYSFPILIPIFIGLVLVAVSRLKNKPCDPNHVRKFFDGFRIGGHRGAPKSFPENGMAGFMQAKNDGADLIEFDVSLTKDGEAVLLHDDDLDRTTNLSGPIREKTLAQLECANISAHFTRTTEGDLAPVQNEGIPKLEAVVKWSIENNMKMLFDVKDSDPELVHIIGNLFEKYDLYDKAIVCSFYPWVVYLVKQGNQKILSGLTWRRKFFSYKDIENTLPRYTGLYHYIYVLIDIIHVFLLRIVTPWFLGADLLLTNNLDISKGFVQEQKERGIHVAVWTVNDVAEMHWMLEELSVPILTDHPSYVTKISHLSAIRGQDYNEPALQNAVNHVNVTSDFTN
ncbi:glycerophosphodiester phosphodiesterase family protein [Dictyocaulus viviparus]|uniref:Glycerophosphodiester phosphodiesterase family protein n=1 Tax=Dictyocaulus viviparus TaxID=29172 RepID=A0A0D8XT35_DICVI|nr:glycerophosphodiester phosphodiesterase family protein [Dictyocaulus viviparus]